MYVTMQQVREGNAALGQHWFEPDTMRFFRSRVASTGEQMAAVPGSLAFVSSEKTPHGDRAFSVRLAIPTRHPRIPDYPDGYEIETVGGFMAYATSAQAKAAAKRLAALTFDQLPPEVAKLYTR